MREAWLLQDYSVVFAPLPTPPFARIETSHLRQGITLSQISTRQEQKGQEHEVELKWWAGQGVARRGGTRRDHWIAAGSGTGPGVHAMAVRCRYRVRVSGVPVRYLTCPGQDQTSRFVSYLALRLDPDP